MLFRQHFCIDFKWTIIPNFFQAKSVLLFKIFTVFPFSLTFYLPKEKKTDKRKEKEVSIMFGSYFSLQIKNRQFAGKLRFLVSDNILSSIDIKICEIFCKLMKLLR